MKDHAFIFTPRRWAGEGKISFSMAKDELAFAMHWTINPQENGSIAFSQLIEVAGFSDPMRNNFTLSEMKGNRFTIELENHIVGRVQGTGFVDENKIAWEFRNPEQAFDGYEIYELREDGIYKMRAEFTAGAGLRTHVQGYIA